jgi:hypothetical protein
MRMRLGSADRVCGLVEEVGVVVFGMVPEVVGASAALEAGLAAQKAAGVAAAAPASLGVTQMGGDLDSQAFAQVARMAAAQLLAIAGDHVANRAGFSGATSLAGVTTVASEEIRAAATAI